ncbi:glycosyltransferase [Aestuariivirga litoralis]|uniref:glycosyltransferase n=1 Tax=Aestuariivirga litoralis TaxID=2650924 RepID=UPI0018C5641A|nr:glycosyltransferase [Aestuariivirga litoralis]
MLALQIIIGAVGIVSGAVILVFALAQAWLAFRYTRAKAQGHASQVEPAPWSGKLPTVLLQLPIYNERYVVERLLRCMAQMDYPKDKLTIQLLDDSNDETTAIAARVIAELTKQGIHIEHVRRPDRKGFKAGALDYGLKLDNSEFIAIFDADFLPHPDFVKRVVAYFADSNVGMVQTRWEHLNADYSLITRMMAFAIDNHFSVEHGGRQASDSFINFNGTGGMWRRKTIEDAGGWKSDTLTEDLDLSFRSQIKGWKFIFAESITTPSELPVQMSAVRSQQFRWTKGAAETGRKTLNNLWNSNAAFSTKIVGSFHMLNSFIFLFLLCFGLSAAALPFLGLADFASVATILNTLIGLTMVATVFTFYTSQRSGDFGWTGKSPLNLLYTTITFMAMATGLCIHLTRAVLQGLIGQATPFVRTPKLNIMSNEGEIKTKQAYNIRRVPIVVFLETALAIMFVGLIILGLTYEHHAIAFTGVYAFYAIGFSVVSLLSWREASHA